MDLSLSEEQKIISASAEKYFLENYSFEQRLKHLKNSENRTNQYWTEFSNMGWLGLPFRETSGGLGGNVTDIMVLMEAFGKSLVLESYIIQVLLSGKILEEFISNELAKRHLSDLILGKKRYTFAFAETNYGFDLNVKGTLVKHEKEKYFITGKKNFVIGLDNTDFIIFPALDQQNDSILLFCIPKNLEGLDLNLYSSLDDIKAGDIVLDNLALHKDMILGRYKINDYKNSIEYIIDYVTLAMCSDALGVIENMYDKTLEYVKTREQFGSKIGSFQVIQHKLVDIYIKKEEMRSLNYMGQLFIDKDSKDRKKKISLNKIFLGSDAKIMGQECIQIHGGMGVANEMDVGHFFKRLTVMCGIFGNTDYHLKRFADNDIY